MQESCSVEPLDLFALKDGMTFYPADAKCIQDDRSRIRSMQRGQAAILWC